MTKAVKVEKRYRPFEKQLVFDNLVQDGKHKFILLLSGIQYGKTTQGIRSTMEYIYNSRHLIEVRKSRGSRERIRMWYVAPTFDLSRTMEEKFLEEYGDLVVKRFGKEGAYELYPRADAMWLGNIRLEFKSTHKPDSLRSKTVDVILHDEAAISSLMSHKLLLGRILAQGGIYAATTTPKGANWLVTDFIEKVRIDGRYVVVTAKTSDNKTITVERLEALRELYGGELAAQELDGEIVEMLGGILKNFREDIHVIQPFGIPSKDAKFFVGIDTGFVHKTVYIWMAFYKDTVYIIDEHVAKKLIYSDHVKIITDDSIHPFEKLVSRRWRDNFGSTQQAAAELRRFNIETYPHRCEPAGAKDAATKEAGIWRGIQKIIKLLDLKNSEGKPKLQIFNTCRETIQSFKNYCANEDGNILQPFSDEVDGVRHGLESEILSDENMRKVLFPTTNELVDMAKVSNAERGRRNFDYLVRIGFIKQFNQNGDKVYNGVRRFNWN